MSGVEVLLPNENIGTVEAHRNGAESVDKTEFHVQASGGAVVNSCTVSVDNFVEGENLDKPECHLEKKKKSRRGKSKRRKYKPYFKLSWQERRKRDDRETKRANRLRAEMFAHGQPIAPYNTTQFLMEDNNDVKDLDVQLKAVSAGNETAPIFPKPSRARDSSFSLDSDEDFFYSSPEDEEEFLTKEFSNTYEDLHEERLGGMSKAELIQDYLQLEDKVDTLEKNLKEADAEARERANESDEEIGKGEVHMDPESAEKIRIFQQEINKLIEENDHLRSETERLQNMNKSDSSSIDSDSDSTSTVSCSSNCDCDTSCSESDSGSGAHSDECERYSDMKRDNASIMDVVSSTTDIPHQTDSLPFSSNEQVVEVQRSPCVSKDDSFSVTESKPNSECMDDIPDVTTDDS